MLTWQVYLVCALRFYQFNSVCPLVTNTYSIFNKWRKRKLALGISLEIKQLPLSSPCDLYIFPKKKCSFSVEEYKAVHNILTNLPLIYEIRELTIVVKRVGVDWCIKLFSCIIAVCQFTPCASRCRPLTFQRCRNWRQMPAARLLLFTEMWISAESAVLTKFIAGSKKRKEEEF